MGGDNGRVPRGEGVRRAVAEHIVKGGESGHKLAEALAGGLEGLLGVVHGVDICGYLYLYLYLYLWGMAELWGGLAAALRSRDE